MAIKDYFPVLNKSEKAFKLYSSELDILFEFGNGPDIIIYKENNKDKCYCIHKSFNYKGMVSPLVGSQGQDKPFTVKRIQVFKMNPIIPKPQK